MLAAKLLFCVKNGCSGEGTSKGLLLILSGKVTECEDDSEGPNTVMSRKVLLDNFVG